jgi:hypothetical protein
VTLAWPRTAAKRSSTSMCCRVCASLSSASHVNGSGAAELTRGGD